jgi:hypothetical protein
MGASSAVAFAFRVAYVGGVVGGRMGLSGGQDGMRVPLWDRSMRPCVRLGSSNARCLRGVCVASM